MARLNIAMLSAQEQTQEESTPIEAQSELDVVGQQVEDSIAQATEIQFQIEQTQEAVQETEEVVQQVEEERQVLEQAQAQGGAEQAAMESLQRAMKRFEKRTGVPSAISSMGMESFGSKTTRAQATKIAMEGAKEYIKKLIKILTEAMVSMWKKVKGFLVKITEGAGKLLDRAKKVKEAVLGAKGETAPADAKVTEESVLAFAQVGGKAVEGDKFVTEFLKLTDEKGAAAKEVMKPFDDVDGNDFATKLIEYANKEDKKGEIVQLAISFSGPQGGKKEDGVVGYESDQQWLGNYKKDMAYYFAKDATYEQVAANQQKLSGGGLVVVNSDKKPESVKPLTVEQAIAISDRVIEIMETMKTPDKRVIEFEDAIEKVVTKSKELEKADDADVKQIQTATGIIRSKYNSAIAAIVSFRAYIAKLSKAALDYAVASIRAATGKTQTAQA